MGFNSDLMTGFAVLFEENGLGVFDTAGIYSPESTGIFLGLTPDQPDRAITLMSYPVDDSDLTVVTTGLQIKIRGRRDPREVEDVADAVYGLLHNKSHYVIGNIRVDLSWRQSGAWIGQDGNQRIERSENYYLYAERDAPHKVP